MIVFLCVLIFIIICILLSSISVKVEKIAVKNADDLSNLLICLIEKDFVDVFDYIEISIKMSINIFYFIPIRILMVREENIKKRLIKKNKKTPNKVNKKKNNKEIRSFIEDEIKIEKLNIDLSIGLGNSAYTAIFSSAIISVLQVVFSYIINQNKKLYSDKNKEEYYSMRNYKYNISPVYNNKIVFQLESEGRMSVSIIKLLKEFFRYKSSNFVNNTSKINMAKEEI